MPKIARPEIRFDKLPREIEQALEPTRKALSIFSTSVAAALNKGIVVGDTLQFVTKTVVVQGDGEGFVDEDALAAVQTALEGDISTLEGNQTRVYVRAHANVTQNFTRDAALAVKNFSDERVDTHNQWNGSRFTCSQPGVYSIQACIGWSTSSFVDDTDLGAMDLVSNIGTYRGPKLPAKGGVLRLYHHILLPMGVGDWVEAHTGHTAGGLGAVLTTSADTGENWIMIARVSA